MTLHGQAIPWLLQPHFYRICQFIYPVGSIQAVRNGAVFIISSWDSVSEARHVIWLCLGLLTAGLTTSCCRSTEDPSSSQAGREEEVCCWGMKNEDVLESFNKKVYESVESNWQWCLLEHGLHTIMNSQIFWCRILCCYRGIDAIKVSGGGYKIYTHYYHDGNSDGADHTYVNT